jgi:hypothetical protein
MMGGVSFEPWGGGTQSMKRAASVLLAAALTVASLSALRPAAAARADEVTISTNNLRDGWDSNETTGSLTPATLSGGSFGELFSTGVDGQVYAQPLALDAFHEVVVATENDFVYGIDATSGAIKWSSYLPALVNPSSPGTPWPATADHCGGLQPNIGVTSTPVYDPTATTSAPDGTVYLVSEEVPAGGPVNQPEWFMHAVDPATGAEIPGWPVQIKGSPSNDPTVPFQPLNQLQRPGLLLTGGQVYAAFGSNCDFTPYDGYVVAVNTASQAQTMWTDEAGLTSTQAGIWQSGAGLMSDSTGRVFFTSGNGISPPPGPGASPPSQLAESVVRLAMQTNGTLAAQDFFSPANAPHLDSIDADLGSGGPVGLPFGTATLTDLLVQIGKDGRAFVLDATNLGGREQGPGGTDAAVSINGPFAAGPWGHPAAYADTPVLNSGNVATANDYVYYVAKNGPLFYLKAGLNGSGAVTLSDFAQSSGTFGYTAGAPVVTSAGTGPGANSTAVVWVVNTSDQSGATGALEAFPAIPGSTCAGSAPASCPPLWTFPLTKVGKFTTPATDSGRVYIATRGAAGVNCPPGAATGDICGQVLGFGSPSAAPLGGTGVNFGNVGVGTSAPPAPVTVTASAAVTVTSQPTATGPGFSVAGPFMYTPKGGSPTTATFPQAMNPGDTLAAQNVTFSPSVPGAATGAVQFSTDAANFPVVNVPLTGNGTQPGFVASSSLALGSIAVHTKTQQSLIVSNDNTVTETLSVTAPSSPFGVTGPGTSSPVQVQPGTSVTLTVSYNPAVVRTDNGTLTLTDQTDSLSTPVALSGTGVTDVIPTLTPSPATISFGSVPLGQQAEQVITVTNSGNLPATITATTPPGIPFGAPDAVASGLPLSPGTSLSIPITYTPTSISSDSATYQLTWTDAAGSHPMTVPISGTAVAPTSGIAVPPPGGGWTFNGTAAMHGTTANLTPIAINKAGSAVYSDSVASNGLTATFKAKIFGGTGGDGMTLSLLDATKTTSSALGSGGRQLGFGGLHGVAICLVTAKGGSNYPSSNFIGIATGVSSGQLVFAATATNVPKLRIGTHLVGVTVSGGTITVTIDGRQVISKAVAVPHTVRLAFTGGTGMTLTDNHEVTAATITAGGGQLPQPGGGWSYNGSSVASGPDTMLTAALASRAGTVIFPTAVTSAGLAVTWNVQLGGGTGTGGDGMTLALLDPAKTSPTAVGGSGPLLGVGTSLPGVYVMLGTDHTESGWPTTAFVALSTGSSGAALVPQFVAEGIQGLRGGTHTLTVTVIKDPTLGFVVTVFMDGVRLLQDAEPTLTPTVLLGFTAATGNGQPGGTGGNDVQIVRDVAISAP